MLRQTAAAIRLCTAPTRKADELAVSKKSLCNELACSFVQSGCVQARAQLAILELAIPAAMTSSSEHSSREIIS